MSKPAKKKGLGIPLNEFEFDPSELDLDLTRTLITVFDGYRINRTFDLTFVEKKQKAGNLPRGFIRQWPTIRGVLHKFAALGPKVPHVEEWLKQRQIIAFIALALLTISAPVLVIGWILRVELIMAINIPLALIAVGAIFLSWLTNAWYNRKVAWAIHNFLEDNPNILKKERELLHEWVQALIYHAARIMRKEGIKSKDKPTKFYNNDYNGVEVIQEPGGLRKHYTMRIITERKK
ncbi:MAG: hypothetical protein DRP09_21025 [Candidatus Thorarchaeota archaeon]|nr:MAG: hypothetical protein DRP09_21025 [Candidatus Thorarchaeota archaeon]